MKISIEDIVVDKKRIRQNTGDLTLLMQSMDRHGLLQPIIISDSDCTLLAGYRRLTAAKNLGWTEIDVRPVKADSKLERLEIEIDENEARKNFDLEELSMAKAKRDKLSRPSLFRRFIGFLKKVLFGK